LNASVKINLTFYTRKTLTWVNTNTLTWELIGTAMWVNTNTLMWELIGTVTWVYTKTLTWELNRYRPDRTGPDRTGPDQTPFKSFNTLDSDCYADTYYPDHFGSLLPLFNHITPRVM